MPTEDELRAHSNASFNLKLSSLLVFIVGVVLACVLETVALPLGIAGFVLATAAFVLMQARAEWHWQQFLSGAAALLGDDHPLVERGRKL